MRLFILLAHLHNEPQIPFISLVADKTPVSPAVTATQMQKLFSPNVTRGGAVVVFYGGVYRDTNYSFVLVWRGLGA